MHFSGEGDVRFPRYEKCWLRVDLCVHREVLYEAQERLVYTNQIASWVKMW